MKLQVITGVRPQFIKAAPFLRELESRKIEYELIHTGQHYDYEMSQVFFEEIGLPKPHATLETGLGTHAEQTSRMLVALEVHMIRYRPQCVVVFGDTNSTLAGALAASKLHIPIVHIEAGIRSFNRRMPEEINRVLADTISRLLFCPSQVGVKNLKAEGIVSGVFDVGDVMLDAINLFGPIAVSKSDILDKLEISDRYLLLTLHRAENVDCIERLESIMRGLGAIEKKILFPIHPRTRKRLQEMNIDLPLNVTMVDPVGYLDFLKLQSTSQGILTDSGGLQKEAYWQGVPCVTLRDETEWVETVELGWNVLVGADEEKIAGALQHLEKRPDRPLLYGNGTACAQCVDIVLSEIGD